MENKRGTDESRPSKNVAVSKLHVEIGCNPVLTSAFPYSFTAFISIQ